MSEYAVEAFAPSELRLYQRNPRKGKVDAIVGSLLANGQYRPVVVNRGTHTGRENEVLAGNHTVMAFRELVQKYPDDERWHRVTCFVIDVDEDAAKRIVLADNRTADLGGYDDEVLAELLQELPDLSGTGYTDEDLDKLLAGSIVDGDAPIEEPPVVFGVVVECDTEAQQTLLLERLDAEGFRVRALM